MTQQGGPLQLSVSENGTLTFDAASEGGDAANALQRTFGCGDDEYTAMLTRQVVSSVAARDPNLRAANANGIIAGIHAMRPRDEIEAMLITQMLAINAALFDSLRRANHVDASSALRDVNLGHVNKLARTAAVLLDALHRHRTDSKSSGSPAPAVAVFGGPANIAVVRPGNRED